MAAKRNILADTSQAFDVVAEKREKLLCILPPSTTSNWLEILLSSQLLSRQTKEKSSRVIGNSYRVVWISTTRTENEWIGWEVRKTGEILLKMLV